MKSLLIQNKNTKDALSLFDDSYMYSDTVQLVNALPPKGTRLVTVGTNLSLLAREIYGDDKLSWVLSIYNGVTDEDIVAGTELSYPDKRDVSTILNRFKDV